MWYVRRGARLRFEQLEIRITSSHWYIHRYAVMQKHDDITKQS